MMLRTVSEMMTLREICRRRCGVGVGARNNLSCPISGRKPVSVRYTFYTACLSLTNNILGDLEKIVSCYAKCARTCWHTKVYDGWLVVPAVLLLLL